MADSGLLEQAKNLAQRRQIARARPLAVLLTGLLAVAVALDCASALAWSARKPAATQPVRRPARPRPAASKPPTQAAGAEPTLAAQVQALLQQSQPSPAALLAALRLASQAREAALVAGLAERLAASPKASALQLAQAAALAGGEALVLQLWTKAWKLSARQPVVARQIAQGYVDALLAAGQVAEARAVLVSVLNQTPAGQRRPLYERSAALARLSGEMEETAAQLGASRDPDAQLVAAQLLVETGDEEAGLKVLERAWQSYPGHRALQAALSQALLRLGRREQLRKVVDQVVRLAPGDPLPYLAVLDAHTAGRATMCCWRRLSTASSAWVTMASARGGCTCSFLRLHLAILSTQRLLQSGCLAAAKRRPPWSCLSDSSWRPAGRCRPCCGKRRCCWPTARRRPC